MSLLRSRTFALACLTFSTPLLGQGFGSSELIHEWEFRLDSDPTDAWREVIVPHDWSVEYPADPDNASCTGYLPGGIAWYRADLEIPSASEGKRFYLYFEGVYNRSEVFINGTSVGQRPNGYVSFLYDVTPHVNLGESNSVEVRVDHSLSADSRWYTGSGIYRPVHLITANPIHLGLWGIHYSSAIEDSELAWLTVNATVLNHTERTDGSMTLRHELLSPDGTAIAESETPVSLLQERESEASIRLRVPHPKLWSVDEPNLYSLKTTLLSGDQILDESITTVGIRSLEFDPNKGFALNGDWMKIKGVCIHHDAGVLGAAVPKVVWRERLKKLKEIGCNGIRMSHNPQATDLYDLCDELGFLVMDEAFDEWEYPKKKWIDGWNKGTPGFQGAADFFHEWGERDLADMVRRDRNHPSIIMWSIGNEVDYPNDPYSHPVLDEEGIGQQHVIGYQKDQPPAERLGDIAHRLAGVVKEHDTTRPVTAALAGAIMSNQTTYPSALDVVGYNYTEKRYQLDHQNYPNRVLYGSETRHDLAAWKAVEDNEFIFAQFIWTGFDYLGEAGPWPSRGFTTGMIDLANNIKARGHFRRALWSENPVAYLGTYQPRNPSSEYISMDAGQSWNYSNAQSVRVVAYTNGDAAELILNGKIVGTRKAYDPDTAIIHWDIPFEAGKLELVAYRDGKRFAYDSIQSDETPKAIKAKPVDLKLDSKYAVALIPIEVVDADGDLVYESQHEITCSIEGPGRLLGIENASRDASENLRDNVAPANHGRLVAYVQAMADEGMIELTFSANGLEPGRVSLKIGR